MCFISNHSDIGIIAAGGLCAITDRRHAGLARAAPLVQPDAGDRLAALHGEPCDDRRDDSVRRQGAPPCDQQLVEAQHRERPIAHQQPRRLGPVHRNDAADDHPHRPRLDQRHRQPPRRDGERGGAPAQRRPRQQADVADSPRHQGPTNKADGLESSAAPGAHEHGTRCGEQRGAGKHDGERGLLPLPLWLQCLLRDVSQLSFKQILPDSHSRPCNHCRSASLSPGEDGTDRVATGRTSSLQTPSRGWQSQAQPDGARAILEFPMVFYSC
eukprot:gene17072-biopygen2521